MIMRTLGKTKIPISAVAVGTSPIAGGEWWGEADDEESVKTLRAALDAGINFIDTAPSYGFGHAEEVVGRALIDVPRENFVITTKFGLWWEDEEGELYFLRDGKRVRKNVTERAMEAELHSSLKRLGLDRVDLYVLHIQPKEGEAGYRAPEDVARTVRRFQEEGRIRAFGLSNVSLRLVREYEKYIDVALVQNKYSILDRRSEKEVIPYCGQRGITFQAYSPLEKGMLTGKKNYREHVTEKSRETTSWFWPENRRAVYDMLDSWGDLCEKYACGVSNLAAAWVIAQGGHMNALCGARKTSQALSNAQSGKVGLSPDDVLRMREDADRVIALSQKG